MALAAMWQCESGTDDMRTPDLLSGQDVVGLAGPLVGATIAVLFFGLPMVSGLLMRYALR
jgi:hypothetical protein